MIVQDYYLDSEVNIEIWLRIQCENIPEMPLKHITQIIFWVLPLRVCKLTIHIVTGSNKRKLQWGGRVVGEVVGWNMHYKNKHSLNS